MQLHQAVTFLIPIDYWVRRLKVELLCDLYRVARTHIKYIFRWSIVEHFGGQLKLPRPT
jgi:hypothetical protein